MKTTTSPSELSPEVFLPDDLVEKLMADDMLPEYDIDYSKARPNRFAIHETVTQTIKLDADVAAVFNTDESVNRVLRALIQAMPQATHRKTG